MFFLLAASLVSCNNNAAKEETTSEEKVMPVPNKPASLLEVGCYIYNANNNNINLEITSLENGVAGNLTYSLDGKDKNKGTFAGNVDGDKLIGTYTFNSEGKESKREVAFLVKDNELIEGYGDLKDNGTTFADKSSINYSSTMPLTKQDCSK